MRTIERTNQFKSDYKRELMGRYRVSLEGDLVEVLKVLVRDVTLSERFHDHALTGDWKNFRDCHIKPDLVLIYQKTADNNLKLVRLGSHSELGL